MKASSVMVSAARHFASAALDALPPPFGHRHVDIGVVDGAQPMQRPELDRVLPAGLRVNHEVAAPPALAHKQRFKLAIEFLEGLALGERFVESASDVLEDALAHCLRHGERACVQRRVGVAPVEPDVWPLARKCATVSTGWTSRIPGTATCLRRGVYQPGAVRTSGRWMPIIGVVTRPMEDGRLELPHPHYAKPELVATAPIHIWLWDITRPLGPKRWTYFYLYVVLDHFSRYVVRWIVTERESATFA